MGSVGNKDEPKWPVKSREIQNHHLDSHVWNNFPFREDDIIIDTWAKAGTTWTQQIVGQLVFNGADDVNPHEVSPWLDMRHVPDEPTIAMLEAQKHRRFIKSHLPLDGLVYSPKAKYLFVARDARDTMWSMHNHFIKATPFFWQMVNDTPGRVGCAMKRPKEDPRDHFCDFLDTDSDEELTHSPFWQHIRGFWEARHLPNLLLVHYNDLKGDMEGEIRRIAKFLEIEVPEDKWPAILEHCSFKYMKENASRMSPPGAEAAWENGGETFIYKGTKRQMERVANGGGREAI